MNRWKKLVSVTITACLLWSIPAQATLVIPEGPGASSGQNTGTGVTNSGVQSGETAQPVDGPGSDSTNTGTSGTASSGGPASSGTGTNTAPGTNSGTNTGAAPGANTGAAPGTNTGAAPGTNTGTGPSGSINTNTNTTIGAASTISQPEIQSEGAVVMDAATGSILYEKNGSTKYYPASITKLMTALLVIERCNLDDTVTFSAKATTNLEAGAVSLNITEGDKLTVRQCLYALLLKSANEVANGLAEHVAGSNEAFAKLMNEKAASLGCTNTNFVNPHGLNNSNHYTTARDMALIARAAFQNDTLRTIDTTLSYQFPATKKGKAKTLTMGHKMMYSTDSRYYPGIIGGKTGYTSLAGNTLVTGVEQNGVRLIAVVLKSKNSHYTDTKALLDYGFAVMKNTNGANPSATAANGWKQDSTGWYYIKSDGTRASGEWLNLDGSDYWFDTNAYMATGWRQFSNGAWYYFRTGGAMAVNYWAKNQGNWFYLGSDGVMLKNATTPDGYYVDGSGICQNR